MVPLDDVKGGEEVKVAYINTKSNSRMHKLSHFGITPGTPVLIHQRYPSFVIKCGENQIALEEEIAKEIYVWRKSTPSSVKNEAVPVRKRWRFGRNK